MANWILIFFQVSCFLISMVYADNKMPFKLGTEDACNRCNCTEKAGHKVYVINCAEKGLNQILSNYGNLIEINNETMNKIVDVTFTGNQIKNLNRLAKTMAKVSFSCRQCELTDITIEAFADTPNILALDLSFNRLNGTAIKPTIFRGNQIDDATVESISLLHIDLSSNMIESLASDSFKFVKRLRRLSLAKNPLNGLDNETVLAIASLNGLVRLDLSFTGLLEIPDQLFNDTMPQLRELNLEGNYFTVVPESIAFLGKSLRALFIGSTAITYLGDESFLGLKNLVRLSIDNMTAMKKIHAGTFSSLESLEILNCSNNHKLQEFDLGYLSWSTFLREIYISNCSLKSLAITIPKIAPINDSDALPLNRLRYLKLENNPWHCDCDLYKSLERIKRHNLELFTHNGGARCETPYELVSDLFTDLTSDTSCVITNLKKPYRIPAYELPSFLRPRSILVSLLSIMTVIIIGLCIGLVIVYVKKKFLNSEIGFAQPIRYTTVRNSTASIQQ